MIGGGSWRVVIRVIAVAAALTTDVVAQEPDRAGPALSPARPRPIHERVRIAALAHMGAPFGSNISSGDRQVADEGLDGGLGAGLAVDVPLGSPHWGLVGAGRYTSWIPEWESLAGYGQRHLFDVSVAPKLGASVGSLELVQFYVQAPIGVALSTAPDERFEGVHVSVEDALGLTYGLSGGMQILFDRSPVGLGFELGMRRYLFSHRYAYAPADGAAFPPSSEDVRFHIGWIFAQVGLVMAL